ncbi:sodium:proline symporter [Clostridia bacterium]|nr:sodium:proline symporter [Clostridia bacterium]
MILAIVVYAALLILLGIAGYRKVKNENDFIIGGRRMGVLASALGAEASDMSAWLFMGLPGAIFLTGAGEAWIAIGLLVGTIFNWLFIANRLREHSIEANDSITIPSFFENALTKAASFQNVISEAVAKKYAKAIKLIVSVVIILFFCVYVGSGFIAGGQIFSTIFGVNYTACVLVIAAVIIIYSFLGGYLSVAWADIIQGIMIFIAVLLVPLLFMQLAPTAAEVPAEFMNPFSAGKGGLIQILSGLAWGLGYLGMPHIIIRFMSIKSKATVKKSAVVAIVWVVFSLFGAVLIGLIAKAKLVDVANPESVFFTMINQLFTNTEGSALAVNFPFLAGLLFCAIIGATMSTAAGQLLMASSVTAKDIIGEFAKKELSQANKLWINRIIIIIVTGIGILLALKPDTSIMSLVSLAWAGFGASFGPLLFLILYWRKRLTPQGALAGIITGALAIFVWETFLGFTGLYSLLPGFIASFLAIVITSKATSRSAA